MATAQYYKRNNNRQTLGGMTQVQITPDWLIHPPAQSSTYPPYYKQDGIVAGYTPSVQPGGINKVSGMPTSVSSAPSGGMVGGNMYNSMVAQNAAAQRPAPSYGGSAPNAASQNYAAYMMATQQLPERLAALGIYGTGQAETSQLQLDSAYARAIAAYRGRQGGSAGAQGSLANATQLDNGSYINVLRNGSGANPGGSYSPMNPAGHDIVQTADGRWYDNTVGAYLGDNNYMAAYNAYNAANPQGAAGTGGGMGGGGSGGTGGGTSPTSNPVPNPQSAQTAAQYLGNVGINTAGMDTAQINDIYQTLLQRISSGLTQVDVSANGSASLVDPFYNYATGTPNVGYAPAMSMINNAVPNSLSNAGLPLPNTKFGPRK